MAILVRTAAWVLFGLVSVDVYAQDQKKLPLPVQKELVEMMQMCKDAGGKPTKSPGLLQIADLTGDRLPDFVIDQASFSCEGAESLFSGSGGSQVSVYVSTQDGNAVKAFAGGTFGVKLDKETKPAGLQIIVGGELCGQKVTAKTPRSDYKSCWRPVVWNAQSKKIEYAPVSQIRPVQ